MIIVDAIKAFIEGFRNGPVPREPLLKAERQQLNNVDEDQIDSMVDDSFPASDPPGTY